MRLRNNIILFLFFALNFSPAYSQILRESDNLPQGAIIYSLPQTVVKVTVTVVQETFTPGVYSQFAKKYLDQPALTTSSKSVKIKRVSLDYSYEADPSLSVAVNIGNGKNASANFINFSSNGLIISPGAFSGEREQILSVKENPNNSKYQKELIAPKSKIKNVVYREVEGEDGETKRVAQTEIKNIERSLEERAKESAELIFSLREKKIAILTGDTDANYDGAALGDAMKELDKIDKELLELFYGTTTTKTQSATFEIVPSSSLSSQRYVVCKLSDTEGIVSTSSQGRELVLVLEPQGKINNEPSSETITGSKGKIVYRTPLEAKGSIWYGNKVLGEKRFSIFQFGKIVTFPIETAMGK